jgi:hypothetical protein
MSRAAATGRVCGSHRGGYSDYRDETRNLEEFAMADEGGSKTTTDHDVIRQWAEERGGRPARVAGTGDDDPDNAGVLRIEFQDRSELDEIDWDEFFRTFDEHGLAFVYQERTSDGKPSRFNKFVKR